jgi:hypothetical protein
VLPMHQRRSRRGIAGWVVRQLSNMASRPRPPYRDVRAITVISVAACRRATGWPSHLPSPAASDYLLRSCRLIACLGWGSEWRYQ